MFLACGVGAFTAGIFHLMTHAFFKALLFLGAGSRDPRPERRAGHAPDGRARTRSCPSTYWTMLIGDAGHRRHPAASPASSARTRSSRGALRARGHLALWAHRPGRGALLTAFYMFRLYLLDLLAAARASPTRREHHLHESPPVDDRAARRAGGAVGGRRAASGLPLVAAGNPFARFLAPVLGGGHGAVTAERGRARDRAGGGLALIALSVLVASAGIVLACRAYLWSPVTATRLARAVRRGAPACCSTSTGWTSSTSTPSCAPLYGTRPRCVALLRRRASSTASSTGSADGRGAPRPCCACSQTGFVEHLRASSSPLGVVALLFHLPEA